MSDVIICGELLRAAGVYEYGLVDPQEVEFTEEVRKYCEDNVCRKYGTTWACPPALGTVGECRARAQSYGHMLVFSAKYDIRNALDYAGMLRGLKEFQSVADKLDGALKNVLADYLILGNESCGLCEKCTYPDAPCRYPGQVHGAIEGYGIYVHKLAQQAGLRYNNGPATITYFGAVLYNGSGAGGAP